jgi:hypothetical protein
MPRGREDSGADLDLAAERTGWGFFSGLDYRVVLDSVERATSRNTVLWVTDVWASTVENRRICSRVLKTVATGC